MGCGGDTRNVSQRAVNPPAIVTLTMNPALDLTADADEVRPTEKIRCHGERYDAGGGGINVARYAQALGVPSAAVFTAGGSTGARLAGLVATSGVGCTQIGIRGSTRENFTVNDHASGKQFRFVLAGPRLEEDEQTQCLTAVAHLAESARYIVASGSLPPGASPDLYQRVATVCAEAGVPLILDTSGGGLTHVTSGVFLLKPSLRELRECSGRTLDTEDEQDRAARELIDRGVAQTVLVSLGARGSLLVTASVSNRYPAVRVAAVSGVGAGDAMVAGLTVGLVRGWELTRCVQLGIAAATAKLQTPGTAAYESAEVQRYFAALAAEREFAVRNLR